ncbi:MULTISPECIES: cyclic pyranopterin monophosphate synthase MoaC [unclassified Candidatus Frackibacter]|uniref:cyclic pyranopterin monophosphate synthase MoaC n=1 Tax=unclassified Candidatus Frackibacter TaxID=2648818 RepID=UPI00087E98D9|nr:MULTISPECIES: cyclic pyranopterin monophosphate synthase MoaC [unclassified Candidatus Frackibacter]SDC24031.1 cyclic pyranopterin monophosphate synthase subunit MoaC [Candidatus Frackibacter sp. WG11]SEM47951.1 cyclic pyranopterin monophosphate synthase subunit MoaC [Candidatus Frackibacter sp. WG12]SFL49956.1 cyclic pyranopterin monophosphate synthase subunit MoaC [Candidatus Frackibacter sp. WG13]
MTEKGQDFTHFNEAGRAKMVDVSKKPVTERKAIAEGKVYTSAETINRIQEAKIKKGDVLGVAQIAGIMNAKKTSDIIPMCHPLNLTGVDLDFEINDEDSYIRIVAEVKISSQTGVEMEALTAVSTAALTIYDMCKAVDKGMEIGEIRLLKKTGGQSGDFVREID